MSGEPAALPKLLNGEALYSIVQKDNLLFVTTNAGSLYALTLTLAEYWVQTDADGKNTADGTPLVLGDLVFVASEGTKVLSAFEMQHGTPLYTAPIPGPANGLLSELTGCPASMWGGNGALVVANEHVLSAFDPLSLDLIFNITLGLNTQTSFGSPPSFDDGGTIFWGSADGEMYAIDHDGVVLVSASPTTPLLSPRSHPCLPSCLRSGQRS